MELSKNNWVWKDEVILRRSRILLRKDWACFYNTEQLLIAGTCQQLNKVPMHSMAHPTEETNRRVLKCPFAGMDDNTTWIFCFNQAKHLFLILFYSRRVHLWVKYFHSFSCLMFCILYWSCITFSVPHLSWTTMSILWRICPTARDHLFGRTRCFQVVKNQ